MTKYKVYVSPRSSPTVWFTASEEPDKLWSKNSDDAFRFDSEDAAMVEVRKYQATGLPDSDDVGIETVTTLALRQ